MSRDRGTLVDQPRIPVTILLVGGSAESAVGEALTAEGRYRVIAVPHQSDVCLSIREKKPDSLVIVGSSESRRTALTSCAMIRRTRTPVRPNILFWATDGDALIARCAWAAGADDVVVGPAQPEHIAERLDSLATAGASDESDDKKLMGAAISGTWKWDLETDEVLRVEDASSATGEAQVDPRVREFLRASFARAIANRGSYSAYYRDIQLDGDVRLFRQHGTVEFNESGTPHSLSCSVFDETHRRRAIRRLVNFDHVEQLPDLIGTVLFEALTEDIRNHRAIVGVLYLNIDPVRNVDDVLDEETTNELLASISLRIASITRDQDLLSTYPSLKTKLASHGAAKYVLLLRELKSVEDFESVAARIQLGLRTLLRAGGRDFATYATVGAAAYPRDGGDARAVLQAAEIAMRKGRQEGGDRLVFFHESLRSGRVQKLETELSLRRAIYTDRLRLHYQPIFDINLRRVVSIESLVRWDDGDGGMIAPDLFIPIAEETSLIVEVGKWVLRSACSQVQAWHAAGFPGLRVSVNIAARQLQSPEFVSLVADVLAATSIPPACLELELTERSIAQNVDTIVSAFRELKRLGVRLVVDDFGTGHSALNYLKNFPVDSIKIDKSFVDGLATNDCDSAITATMIDLAHRLKLTVVAEGVEHSEQLILLQQLGCDAVQGYLFARPMESRETGAWLEAFVGVGGSANWNPLQDERAL